MRTLASSSLAIDRTGKTIVDPDIQRPEHAVAVFGFGQKQDRNLAGPLDRTDLAAQAQAVVIVQSQIDDDQFVGAFRGLEQGVMRRALDIHGMDGRQRRDQPLDRTGTIVDEQDAAVHAIVARDRRQWL